MQPYININNNNLISIIVRTVSPQRFGLLLEAISSIAANDYRPIEIILIAQTEDNYFLEKLENSIARFSCQNFRVKLIINRTSNDERSKNLNLGLANVEGRYIGFLDDDDIYYPNHISTLLHPLEISDSLVWTYGDVAAVICEISPTGNINKISKNYPYIKKEFSKVILWHDNFIPIHSYIIDRKKITNDLLKFDESLKVMEDYAFILRLASLAEPRYIPVVTCEYRFYTDASNSSYYINQILGLNYIEKAKIWKEASYQVERIKKELMPDYTSGLFLVNNRRFLLAKFAFLYKFKKKFPAIWSWGIKLATNLKLFN